MIDKNSKKSPIKSWSQWFDRAAEVFDDPRMKVAYYSHEHKGQPYSQEAVEATFKEIWGKLKPARNDVILDIGCGVGFLAKNFSGQVNKIIGTDIALHMVESAYILNPKETFLVCAGNALCFKDKQFDCTLCYGVTQYLPNESAVTKMLDDILLVSKDNCKILIGDVMSPVQKNPSADNKTSGDGQWWPDSLNHKLSKLYLEKSFFKNYCSQHEFQCSFFDLDIKDRHIPTPRYDVLMQR